MTYSEGIKIAGGMPPLWDALQVMLPDHEENLLLKTCTSDGDRAAKSWHSWTAIRPDLRAAIADGRAELKPLLPLLHFGLTNSRVALDQSTVTVLRAATIWEERRSERIHEILADCVDALARASVTPILLNGVALAETAYPRPSLRHCHDVDLLVSPADLSKARHALGQCGISAIAPKGKRDATIRMAHVDGLPINLHSGLLSGRMFSLPEEEMRNRAISVPIAGRSATILSPSDMLLHLCGRFAEGRISDLTWVADAAGLLGRCGLSDSDWDLLLRAAQSAGLSLPLFIMLHYLRTEIAVPIPDDVLDRLSAQARHSPVMDRDAALAGARNGRGHLAAMIRRSGWRSRWEILRHMLLPSRAFLRSWCAEQGLEWSSIWYLARPWREFHAWRRARRRNARNR